MELIVEDLIKCHWWFTPTWEQNKQSCKPNFCRQLPRECGKRPWGLDLRLPLKEPCTRLGDLPDPLTSQLFQQAVDKINVTHWEYFVSLSEKDKRGLILNFNILCLFFYYWMISRSGYFGFQREHWINLFGSKIHYVGRQLIGQRIWSPYFFEKVRRRWSSKLHGGHCHIWLPWSGWS